jgi:hypothetical protein
VDEILSKTSCLTRGSALLCPVCVIFNDEGVLACPFSFKAQSVTKSRCGMTRRLYESPHFLVGP